MNRYQIIEGKNRNHAVLDTYTSQIVFESDSRLIAYDKRDELSAEDFNYVGSRHHY